MTASSQHRPARWPALVRYIVGWTLIGGVLAGVVVVLLRGADDEVVLPPVQETELATAADDARCRLRRGGQGEPTVLRVEGPRRPPIPGGDYDDEQSSPGLVGAMRNGTVVVQYRPDVDDETLDALRELQQVLPRGTILAPKRGMPYAVAATGWRRLLGCRSGGRATVDAVRLFQGRYVGLGPEAEG